MTHQEYKRVNKAISHAVMWYCRRRLYLGFRWFRMEDLTNCIREKVGPVAPDSPGRILRGLRQRGWLDYKVLSRRKSEYEIVYVRPERGEDEPVSDTQV